MPLQSSRNCGIRDPLQHMYQRRRRSRKRHLHSFKEMDPRSSLGWRQKWNCKKHGIGFAVTITLDLTRFCRHGSLQVMACEEWWNGVMGWKFSALSGYLRDIPRIYITHPCVICCFLVDISIRLYHALYHAHITRFLVRDIPAWYPWDCHCPAWPGNPEKLYTIL